MVVPPLSPGDVTEMLELTAARRIRRLSGLGWPATGPGWVGARYADDGVLWPVPCPTQPRRCSSAESGAPRDLGRLALHRDRMPGTDANTPLLVVSRTGSAIDGLPVPQPPDLLVAYGPFP